MVVVNFEVAKKLKEKGFKQGYNIFGYKVDGFAFPFHDQTEEHIQILKNNIELSYIRYSYLNHSGIHQDKYHIHINALYDDEDIYEQLEIFKKENDEHNLFDSKCNGIWRSNARYRHAFKHHTLMPERR